MCRKNQLQGCCGICLGLGIMVGYWLDSWFFCSIGALALIFLGFSLATRK